MRPFSNEEFHEIQRVVSANVILEQSIESSRLSVDSTSVPKRVEEIQNPSSLIPHHQVEKQVTVSETPSHIAYKQDVGHLTVSEGPSTQQEPDDDKAVVSEGPSQIVDKQIEEQLTVSEGPHIMHEEVEDQVIVTKKPSRPRKSLWKRKRFSTRSTIATPTTAIPERDPHSSKFGRRFRLSNRSNQIKKIENPNVTYFPKDHVSDGHVYNIRKALAEEEGYIMEDQYPFYSQYMESYTNFSRYLSTRHIYFKKYWTEEERVTFQQLNSERRERYRHYMLKKYEDFYVEEEKQRKHEREILMKKYQRISNGKCEGCRYLGLKDYPITLPFHGTTRKFKGNEEVFNIYNSTHCT